MSFEVRVGPRARDDLRDIYDWITSEAGSSVADRYLDRIERALLGLADMPNRGSPRDDLSAGLRTLAFERRATIAYTVAGQTVTIQRILHAGRDLDHVFGE